MQISHNDQYTILNKDFDRQVIQYDHMHVQQEPLLLFRRTDKNCYINIIEHTPAKTITSTCMFLYYHKITLHANLVTTSNFFFYLLNINDELKITCGKYSRKQHFIHILSASSSAVIHVIVSYSQLKYNSYVATPTIVLMVISSFTTPSTLSLNSSIPN